MMTEERIATITSGLAAYREEAGFHSKETERLLECSEELLAEVKRLRALIEDQQKKSLDAALAHLEHENSQ